ncbi:MAG: EamA family transporter [Phycisphaeraceae bacterium]
MMLVGVLCGLVTAVMHAIGYIFSRRFVVVQHASVVRLLVLGHVIMAGIAVAAFPFVYSPEMPPLSEYAGPLLGASFFYFTGQTGLFIALRHTDASRISPLLGLKVAAVAMLSTVALGTTLTLTQWAAVALAVAAAWILNASGGLLPLASILGTILAVTAYAVSDIFIKHLLDAMAPMGTLRGPMTAALLSYALCGFACIPTLPWLGSRRKGDWLWSAPYAVTWLTGIMFMFVSYNLAGLVLGNIAVGTRGLVSIALGVLLAKLGMVHLEQRLEPGVLPRRIAAAIAMVLAIALFVAASQNAPS